MYDKTQKRATVLWGVALFIITTVSNAQTMNYTGKVDIQTGDNANDFKVTGPAGYSVNISGNGYELQFSRDGSNYIDAVTNDTSSLVFRIAGLCKAYINSYGLRVGRANTKHALEVEGVLQLRNRDYVTSGTPSTSGGGILYTNYSTSGTYNPPGDGTGNGLYAAWNSLHTLLTSHADPRQVKPEAQTSFANPAVALPFSFAHKDVLIGKGAVVDLGKMVNFIEKKMQLELGSEGGRLTYLYDLPATEKVSLNEWQVKNAIAALDEMPRIKVALGADGAIPADSVETVEEIVEQPVKVVAEKLELDLENMKVVTRPETKTVLQKVRTGRMVKKLKAGWEMREDGLYRRPTVEDLGDEKLQALNQQIPRWVLDRIPASQQLGMDVKEFAEQIRQILASRNPEETARQSAQAVQ